MESTRPSDRDLGENSGLATLMIYPTLGLCTGIAGLVASQHPWWILLVVVSCFVTGLARLLLGRQLMKAQLAHLPRIRRWFEVSVIAVAACWSTYSGAVVYVYGREWTGLITMMTTIGIVAGAISTLTPHLQLMLVYLGVMLLPSIVAIASPGGPAERLAGAIATLFMIFIAIAGRRHHLRYVSLHRALEELDSVRAQQEELLQLEKHHHALLITQNGQLLEARRSAEQASRAKSVFLATMSHEIRTPMNAICGLTDLLLDTEIDTQQRRWLLTLRDSSAALLVLISDILDLSKIEAGQMKCDASAFDLRGLLDELRHLLEAVAQVKGLRLLVQIDEAVPEVIQSDRLKLRQILLNLLGNAIKFSQEGEVRLEVAVTQQEGQQQLQFCCCDEGIGIAESSFRKLFQPFSQGDSRATRLHGGTGLGLAISQELSHLLGGRVWLSSRGRAGGEVPADWAPPLIEEGSQFWLRLPLVLGVLKPSENTSGRLGSHPGGRRLLVAEDNRVNQMVIRETLVRMGHQVTLVSTGLEALEAVKAESFDFVLMDLQMPEMGGLEATRLIRAQVGEAPWIIALTANALTEDRERCLEAGMNDYLSKPVRKEELKAALQRAQVAGALGDA